MVKYVKTKDQFEAELKAAGDNLVVVDFTAKWCNPCKTIAPVFEALSEKYENVVFLKVDVDEAEELSLECGIKSMPTFQFYKHGTKVKEFSGASPAKLEEALTSL